MARIKLDDASFQAEALRSADKAGKTVGDRMSGQIDNRLRSGLKTALTGAAGAALGATFAIAAKGAAELDEATTNLIRDTGLTGEAAKEAKDQLAGMYRGNLQGFDQISVALAKVYTDLGLTGEAAGIAAEQFLAYQTATGQSGDAVAAYDDILDAWNLTADKAPEIMDKLIASHQKFGGVVSESESALSAMAPAMQAANMSIDDGIALLNLFNTAGIDAAKAPTMLAKAVKQLKPGQDINDLIAQLGAIEDPTLRAQEAMKIFGARTGVGMAQAIKPGMKSLDEFMVSMKETEGATDRAAEASLSWGDRWKLALKNVGGMLAQFGQNFGPLLMVAGQFGPKAIAGIGGLFGAAGAKLGILSRGASPASPMFTSEVGVGGIAGGKKGILGTVVKLGAALGLATVALELWQNSLVPLNEANAQQTKDISKQVAEDVSFKSRADLEAERKALGEGLTGIINATAGLGPLQGALYGGQIEALKADIARVNAELERRGATGGPRAFLGSTVLGPPTTAPDEAASRLSSIDATLTETQRQLHADLVKATETIRTSNDPKAISAAIAAVLKSVLGGVGSATQTKALVAELAMKRDAALAAGDRATATLFANAIRQVEPFAKGRQWQQEQIAEARKIVESNKATADKVAALKAIQADLLTNQRTMAADLVGKLIDTISAINKLPVRIKNALGGLSLQTENAPGKAKDDTTRPSAPGASVQQTQNVREFAAGGFFRPRQPMVVGELRPELLIPDVGGRIEPRVPGGVGSGGNTYNVAVQGLVRARDPFEIATQLKRVASFGVLTPRREPA